MPLNAEDRYEQEEFERSQYSRPTEHQLEIALLTHQLEHAQDTVKYLDDYIEKQTKQLDLIHGVCRDASTGRISDGKFKDRVMAIVGWRM